MKIRIAKKIVKQYYNFLENGVPLLNHKGSTIREVQRLLLKRGRIYAKEQRAKVEE